MKMPAKLKKIILGNDDILVVTVGSLEHNIIPTTKDLKQWREFLIGRFNKNSRDQIIIVPPVVKFKVLKAIRRGEMK